MPADGTAEQLEADITAVNTALVKANSRKESLIRLRARLEQHNSAMHQALEFYALSALTVHSQSQSLRRAPGSDVQVVHALQSVLSTQDDNGPPSKGLSALQLLADAECASCEVEDEGGDVAVEDKGRAVLLNSHQVWVRCVAKSLR